MISVDPAADMRTVIPTPGGHFNTCYAISTADRKYLLRVSPPLDAVIYRHELHLLQRETTLLDADFGFPWDRPKILWRQFGRTADQRDYVVQSFIAGNIWGDSLGLSRQRDALLWAQARRGLEHLGAQHGAAFGAPAPAPAFSRWGDFILFTLNGFLADLQQYELWFDGADEARSLVERSADILNEVRMPHLVHGDLWPKNIIIPSDGSALVVGVIDWERSYWGDPLSSWILIDSKVGGMLPRAGYRYRCSITSADYLQVPIADLQWDAATALKVAGKAYLVRNSIYYLLFLLLRRLEQQRYPRREDWIFAEFAEAAQRLRRHLT